MLLRVEGEKRQHEEAFKVRPKRASPPRGHQCLLELGTRS
jgi:hypothetical protein